MRPLIQRLARDVGTAVHVTVRNARGGHGKALGEFRSWQSAALRLAADTSPTDLLVLVIDGNCTPWNQARADAEQLVLADAMTEYAPDIVAAMDLFRAGKTQPSLKALVDDVRTALKAMGQPGARDDSQ